MDFSIYACKHYRKVNSIAYIAFGGVYFIDGTNLLLRLKLVYMIYNDNDYHVDMRITVAVKS